MTTNHILNNLQKITSVIDQISNGVLVYGNKANDLDSTLGSIVLSYELNKFFTEKSVNDDDRRLPHVIPVVNGRRDQWMYHFETDYMLSVILGSQFNCDDHLIFMDDLKEIESSFSHIILDHNDCSISPTLLLDHHNITPESRSRINSSDRINLDPEFLSLEMLNASLPDALLLNEGTPTELTKAIDTWLSTKNFSYNLEIITGPKVASTGCLIYLVFTAIDRMMLTTVDAFSYAALRGLIIQDARNFKKKLEDIRWTTFDLSVVNHIERHLERMSFPLEERKKLYIDISNDSTFNQKYENIGPVGLLHSDMKIFRYKTTADEVYSMHWSSMPSINKGLSGWKALQSIEIVDLFKGLTSTLDVSEVDVIVVWMPRKKSREVGLFARTNEIRQKYLNFWIKGLPEECGFNPDAFFELTMKNHGSLSFHQFKNKKFTRKNTEPLLKSIITGSLKNIIHNE